MKNLIFFTVITGMFLGIFACGTAASDPKPSSSHQDTVAYHEEMDPKLALPAIHKWDTLRGTIIKALKGLDAPQDTGFVAKGFHIPFNDIQSILRNTGDTSQLFAMLAIEHDAAGNPYLALIFQAPDKTSNQTIRYYDFTKPCPNNCPK